ncbi:hypothetical protein L9F63_001815, partial [Diploptera punctata]
TNFLNTFFPSCYQFQYALCWYAHDSSPVLRHPASTNFMEDIATVHTIIPIHATHVP